MAGFLPTKQTADAASGDQDAAGDGEPAVIIQRAVHLLGGAVYNDDAIRHRDVSVGIPQTICRRTSYTDLLSITLSGREK